MSAPALQETLVSVVMPAYNNAAYVAQALESLILQDYENFELLVVDDGSSDDTAFIVQAYADEDKRLRLLRQEHSGAAAARNAGMNEAKGDYLLFLDADDVFEPYLISSLLKLALATSADVSVCSADCFVNEPYSPTRLWEAARNELQAGCYRAADLAPRLYQALSLVVWNKLWKRDFVERNQLRFQDLMRFNDAFFTIMGLACAGTIAKTRDVLVHYRVEGGTSLMDKSHLYPLCDLEALDAARIALTEKNLLNPGLKQSFDTLCVSTITWRLAKFARVSKEATQQLYTNYFGKYIHEWGLDKAFYPSIRSPRYALEHFLMKQAGVDGIMWAAKKDERDRSSATDVAAELRFAAKLARAALHLRGR